MKMLLIVSRAPAIAKALAHTVKTYTSSLGKAYRVKAVPFSSAEELFATADELTPAEIRDAVMIVDLDAELSDPWNVGQTGRFGLAARLVLQYPEIFFVWYGQNGGWPSYVSEVNSVTRGLDDLLLRIAQHEGGARELFDGTGCRSRLKIRVYNEALAGLDLSPPARQCVSSRDQRLALAADEESSFLSLNGYAAYRFGWRTAIAPTKVELLRLVRASQAAVNGPATGQSDHEKINLAILDWDLRYPDDNPWEGKDTDSAVGDALLNRHLMSEGKSILCCLLKGKAQILLVSGAKSDSLPKDGPLKIVPKPYGGIFTLPLDEKVSSRPPGPAPTGKDHRHSAPYDCLSIANHLLVRSRSLAASDPTDVESWVQVALLALEAKELLGGLSKTASFEALALQQEAEVAAEASFIGVSPDLSVKKRLADLENEAGELATQTRDEPSIRKFPQTAKFSALAQIVNRLRLRLIANEKVRNSEECLRQFAAYQRKLERLELPHAVPTKKDTAEATRLKLFLSWRRSPILNGLLWLAVLSRVLGRGYVDLVTGAGTQLFRLLLSSVGWILLFTLFYLALIPSLPHHTGSPMDRARGETLAARPSCLALFSHSALTFVQLQPGSPEVDEVLRPSRFYRFFLFVQLCIAYLHLGLLISVLHRQLTRRAP